MSSPPILEIQNGKFKGRKVKLVDAEVIVGRGEESKVRIASSEVSREHCVLIPKGPNVLVRDLDSRNGTFIDGRPLQGERLLQPGSLLTIGPLTFLLLGERVATPVPPRPEVALGGKSAVDDRLSDDDIANWLSDEVPSANATSDTAVLPSASDSTGDSHIHRTPSPRPVAPVPNPIVAAKRREFRTIEEEARDIIRRHFEMIGEENRFA